MSGSYYNKLDREVIYLTVSYSPSDGRWYMTTTCPSFITRTLAKEFTAIEGLEIVYMVSGFNNYSDARGFAITYHKAKRDGIVHRYRLD